MGNTRQRHGMTWAVGTALVAAMMALALAGCGSSQAASNAASQEEATASASAASQAAASEAATTLAPGVYTADFNTNDSMFRVNETKDGKGELTVADDGTMTIHVDLAGTGIINIYPGPIDEAEQDGAQLLDPTPDTVTYSDGTSEEVYAFDIPVPAVDQDFTVSIIGNKGKWYEHTVSVTNPVPTE